MLRADEGPVVIQALAQTPHQLGLGSAHRNEFAGGVAGNAYRLPGAHQRSFFVREGFFSNPECRHLLFEGRRGLFPDGLYLRLAHWNLKTMIGGDEC